MSEHFKPLTGKEAVSLPPDKVLIPLVEFIAKCGLSQTELHGELISGRLQAKGVPCEEGWHSLGVTLADAHKWIVNPKTPKHYLDKLINNLSNIGTRQ